MNRPDTYSDAEVAVIRAMLSMKASVFEISQTLKRSPSSVSTKLVTLSAEGAINRTKKCHPEEKPFTFTPALVLRDDDTLVSRCLEQGGFPRAVITKHGTAWAGPDGKPWRFVGPEGKKPALHRRAKTLHGEGPAACISQPVDRLRFVA